MLSPRYNTVAVKQTPVRFPSGRAALASPTKITEKASFSVAYRGRPLSCCDSIRQARFGGSIPVQIGCHFSHVQNLGRRLVVSAQL